MKKIINIFFALTLFLFSAIQLSASIKRNNVLHSSHNKSVPASVASKSDNVNFSPDLVDVYKLCITINKGFREKNSDTLKYCLGRFNFLSISDLCDTIIYPQSNLSFSGHVVYSDSIIDVVLTNNFDFARIKIDNPSSLRAGGGTANIKTHILSPKSKGKYRFKATSNFQIFAIDENDNSLDISAEGCSSCNKYKYISDNGRPVIWLNCGISHDQYVYITVNNTSNNTVSFVLAETSNETSNKT